MDGSVVKFQKWYVPEICKAKFMKFKKVHYYRYLHIAFCYQYIICPMDNNINHHTFFV